MKRAIYTVWQGALDTIYPQITCLACGETLPLKVGLCKECESQLFPAEETVLLPQGASRFVTALAYKGTGGELARALKYGGKRHAARCLAEPLYKSIMEMSGFNNADAICPVPLHPTKLRFRGFNQSREVARELWALGGPPVRELLKRVRDTQPQASLDRINRYNNVKGAFVANKTAAGLRVWLVDDVATTGSTLEACSLALREAGAARVYVAAACYTAPSDSDSYGGGK